MTKVIKKDKQASDTDALTKQFKDLKEKHPEAVLLFRTNDFYESYYEDATAVSEILGITLTKFNGTDIQLTGFPHHALDTYLPKLIRAGKRVAICEKIEAPKHKIPKVCINDVRKKQIENLFKEEVKELRWFEYLLDKTDEKGINDFSIPFHRDAFDYCDGYYVIIRVEGKENLVYYEWSQYSGYSFKLIFNTWFDKIHTDILSSGCSVYYSEKYNHFEYDGNASRYRVCPPTMKFMVEKDGLFNFATAQGKIISEVWFSKVVGKWYRDRKIKSEVIEVETEGTNRAILTTDGAIVTNENPELLLEQVKTFTKEQVVNLWIAKGRPCVYSSGLWNDDDGRLLSPEKAMEKINNERGWSFGKGFYELRWIISSKLGQVALCFKEMSEADMW